MINQEVMKKRTKAFSLSIIKLCQDIPNDYVGRRIGDQLLRSGTSVGANYRAACRARSTKEFISKLGVVVEEADEAMYWMEILGEARIMPPNEMASIMNEANELLSIIVATIKTTRNNLQK